MENRSAALVVDDILEELASVEHDRWAHWQKYMHDKGKRQLDGSLILPADLVSKWNDQINRRYDELSEAEKESDREQVRKYLPVIIKAFTPQDDR